MYWASRMNVGGGGSIEAAHLGLPGGRRVSDSPVRSRPLAVEELPLNLAAAEDLLIQRALQETGGNIADAARLLGVHRTRIYRDR